jgi:hypothetical protein
VVEASVREEAGRGAREPWTDKRGPMGSTIIELRAGEAFRSEAVGAMTGEPGAGVPAAGVAGAGEPWGVS